MKLIACSLSLFLICFSLYSQTASIAPASGTIANAFVADNAGYFSFSNPASLSTLSTVQFGVSYQDVFRVRELSLKSMFVAVPTQLVNCSADVAYYGIPEYNELMAGLSFSRNFGNILHLGVQFNYLSVYFAESNKRFGVLFPTIGAQVALSENVMVGTSVFNPGQAVIKSETTRKRVPSVFSLGLRWMASETIKTLFQVDKTLNGSYRLAGGAEYCMKKFIVFKSGMSYQEYFIPEIGLEARVSVLKIQLNTGLHPLFGLSNRVTVLLSVPSKSK